MDSNLFYKVDLSKCKIKWYERLYLFFLPTYEVLEGDSVHRFKRVGSRVYYLGESFE